MIKKALLFLTLYLSFSMGYMAYGQITSNKDFIEKIQELRTLSQKLGKYYILTQLYPTSDEYKKKQQENVEKFNNILVELTENAQSEEISIEFQKLNLTWLLVSKTLQKRYDRMHAGKLLDMLEKMQMEINGIIDMIMQHLSKKERVELVKKAADTRFQFQKMVLYFLAHKAKILNNNIKDRFKDAQTKFKENLSYLERSEFNDENTLMILEMIKNQYKSYGKKIVLDGTISPLTASMVSVRIDDDLKLLVQVYKDRL